MESESPERARRQTLYAAALTTVAVAFIAVTPDELGIGRATALIGAWLLVASLVRYAGIRRRARLPMFRRAIPIRFRGDLGRFTLRAHGDGRHVEVRAGSDVVAEAIATDARDELVVNLESVDDAELDALGAAIGTAIELVAAADEARDVVARDGSAEAAGLPRLHPSTGGVLRTIGSRSA